MLCLCASCEVSPYRRCDYCDAGIAPAQELSLHSSKQDGELTSASGHEHEAVLLRHRGVDGLPLIGPEVGVPKEVLIGLLQINGPPEAALPARIPPAIRLLAVHYLCATMSLSEPCLEPVSAAVSPRQPPWHKGSLHPIRKHTLPSDSVSPPPVCLQSTICAMPAIMTCSAAPCVSLFRKCFRVGVRLSLSPSQ